MRFAVFGIFGGYCAFVVDSKCTFNFAACGKLPNFRPRFICAIGNCFAALVNFYVFSLCDQFLKKKKKCGGYGHNGQVIFAFLIALVIAV